MAGRVRIATYGRRGRSLVRVFRETAHGESRVRVQWSETPGGALVTESFPDTRQGLADAKAYAQSTADRLGAGGAAPMPDRTVRELADAHLAAESEAWAPNTLRIFQDRWGRFEAFVKPRTLAKYVTEETLDEFRTDMRKRGRATNQRAETIKVVKQVFRWARRRKLIAENPIADYTVKLAKGEKRTEVPEWTPEDAARLAGQLDDERAWARALGWRLWCWLQIAATQGGRQKAMRHVAWADVNLSSAPRRHPTAHVTIPPRSMWWNPAYDKTRSERMQPLTYPALVALRVARRWRRVAIGGAPYAGPWVFAPAQHRTAAAGKPWTYQAFNQALRALCVRCRPPVAWVKGRASHGFRKLAAGNVAELTGSERAAADWIGDKSIAVVRKHYLKVRAESQRKVAEQLGQGTSRPSRAARNRNATATDPLASPKTQTAPVGAGAVQVPMGQALTEDNR